MSLIQSLKLVLSPPHRAAYPFLAIGMGITAFGRLCPWRPIRLLGRIGLAFTGFCLYFFRNPKRVVPRSNNLIVASADGRVTSVALALPPEALNMGKEPVWRVSTFLSVLDVHINRMPVGGKISKIVYHPGKFLNASLDKASEHNERNEILITREDGSTIAVVQIAGLIARRILCNVRAGDIVQTGEIFGLIRFGSRTDIYLPKGVHPDVEEGQTMIGGESIIARL